MTKPNNEIDAKSAKKDLFVKTPFIESIALSEYSVNKVYIKLENCQPSGSFKMRGISRQCQNAVLNGYEEVISSSGGNAGMATACSARRLGLKCRIVVPKTTTENMRERISKEGAEVEIYGEVWNDANERALQIAEESSKRICIHPFDDPILWTGHSTMIDEIAEELGEIPSMIVTCCGGGGLLCGIIEGMLRHQWTSTAVLAMETYGAESFYEATKAGVPVRIPGITSVATCLGSVIVCQKLVDHYLKASPPVLSRLVEDRDAVDACLRFADDHKIIVEAACGAALAAVYTGLVNQLLAENMDKYGSGPVIVIVCGGCSVTLDLLETWRKQFNL